MTIGLYDTLVIEGKLKNDSTFVNQGTIEVSGALLNGSERELGGMVSISHEGQVSSGHGSTSKLSGLITNEGVTWPQSSLEISGSLTNS